MKEGRKPEYPEKTPDDEVQNEQEWRRNVIHPKPPDQSANTLWLSHWLSSCIGSQLTVEGKNGCYQGEKGDRLTTAICLIGGISHMQLGRQRSSWGQQRYWARVLGPPDTGGTDRLLF